MFWIERDAIAKGWCQWTNQVDYKRSNSMNESNENVIDVRLWWKEHMTDYDVINKENSAMRNNYKCKQLKNGDNKGQVVTTLAKHEQEHSI